MAEKYVAMDMSFFLVATSWLRGCSTRNRD
jgi:hypothetical protein